MSYAEVICPLADSLSSAVSEGVCLSRSQAVSAASVAVVLAIGQALVIINAVRRRIGGHSCDGQSQLHSLL